MIAIMAGTGRNSWIQSKHRRYWSRRRWFIETDAQSEISPETGLDHLRIAFVNISEHFWEDAQNFWDPHKSFQSFSEICQNNSAVWITCFRILAEDIDISKVVSTKLQDLFLHFRSKFQEIFGLVLSNRAIHFSKASPIFSREFRSYMMLS
jgi:hypothetical protein